MKTKTIQAPVAPKKAHVHNYPFAAVSDSYAWLKDRKDPDTMKYLKAENKFSDQFFKPYSKLQERIFKEMKSRIKENDSTPEAPWGPFFYFTQFKKGKQYPIYCRRLKTSKKVEVILDCNVLAKGKKHFDLGVFKVSPDHETLVYGVDTTGNENYTLFFKNLKTGKVSKERLEKAAGSAEFSADSKHLFFTVLDEKHRPWQVCRYALGSQDKPKSVYQDTDGVYFVGLSKSSDEKLIFVGSFGKVTHEVWFIDSESPLTEAVCVEPRREGHEYSVDSRNGYLYVLSNDKAPNNKLMVTPVHQHREKYWQELVPESKDTHLVEISLFQDHLVLHETKNALPQWRVYSFSKESWKTIPFKDRAFSVSPSQNYEFNTNLIRVVYETPVQPKLTFDLNLDNFKRKIVKEEKIKGFTPSKYKVERVMVKSHDGTLVPMTVFYKKGLKKNRQNPVMLYGYGSYGYSLPVGFSSKRLSYLDRGFVYALAHVRGGSELGRTWYEEGKFLKKKNTFMDFIACAEHLIQTKWTSADKLAIQGSSAGGMLMGAVINMRPELFAACVAHVPFVDVINTMYDDSLPLTKTEYKEWGNPHEKEFFNYMKSYSPYDNVKAQHYPHLLITGGLNDYRVTYWEPAKWCAKLREMKTDSNLLLMRMKMEAGHFGASGRFNALKEEAEALVFVLKALSLPLK
jgi:oligopeptidase B